MAQPGKHGVPSADGGEDGRMSLAPANALKYAKRLKRKMAGNEIEIQKGTDPWQRVKSEGGRFAKVGVI